MCSHPKSLQNRHGHRTLESTQAGVDGTGVGAALGCAVVGAAVDGRGDVDGARVGAPLGPPVGAGVGARDGAPQKPQVARQLPAKGAPASKSVPQRPSLRAAAQ